MILKSPGYRWLSGFWLALGPLFWSATAYAEEVVFFQPWWTGTGVGTAIYNVEDDTWRWWYEDVSDSRVSPNGREVAYVLREGVGPSRTETLLIADIEGSNPRIVRRGLEDIETVRWSPDGSRLAFTAYDSEIPLSLRVINVDGTDERITENIIPTSVGDNPNPLSWSPDGTKVAFTRHLDLQQDFDTGLFYYDVETDRVVGPLSVIDVESGDIRRDLRGILWDHSSGDIFAILRTSRLIPDTTTSEAAGNLVVFPGSGGAPQAITSFSLRPSTDGFELDSLLDWSPDGAKMLAYDSEGKIVVISRSGSLQPFFPFFDPVRGHLKPHWTLLNPTGVRAEIVLPSPYGQVGEPIEATINITSYEDEPIMVEFPNGLLRSDNEELFKIVVDEVGSVELTPSEPKATFPALVTPLKFGSGELILDAVATIEGEQEPLQVSETFTVPPLLVTLRALPLSGEEPIVNMELFEEDDVFTVKDEEGHVIQPKVEVTLKNLSDAPITALLQGVDPRARDKSAVVGRIETIGDFPVELGTLEAGEEQVQKVDLEITEDGRFEFVATVTGYYNDKPDSTFATAKHGAPIAVGEPYPVELELDFVRTPVITDQNNGAFLVQPGGSIQVIASVNNLTSNSRLQFYGIRAEKHLNALSAHLTSEAGRAINPNLPFVHDHTIDANSSVILGGTILTSKDGAPSGTVEWLGLEDAKLIDDETQEETELTEDDILVRSTVGGWLGNDLAVRIIQDNSRPFAPPTLTGLQEVAVYSYGAMIGMGEWTYDSFDAIGGLGRVAGYIAADPSLLADAVGEGSRAVWEFPQLLGETWYEMSAEEKEEFIRFVVKDVQSRLLLLSTARAPVSAEDYNAVYNWTREATYSLFDGMTEAYASDDPAKIAGELGRISGHAAMEVAAAAVTELEFSKYVKGAEINKYAENAALGPALNNQELALRAIRSGPLSDSTTLAAFGPGPEDLRAFEEVFEAFKVKGYARERSPISYELINNRKVAVWKPESMKPKGISDIDELLLGKNRPVLTGADGNPIDLRGVTGIFWPGNNEEVLARLSGQNLSEEVIEACLARAAKRRKEFQKYYPKFGEWSENGIPVPRNFKDNGIPDPLGQGNPTRDLQVEVILRDAEDGPTLFIPKMANEAGELRYISGDIDWVHFSFLDGTPLDPKTARKLYTVLMDCCGLQHPETVTWINEGKAFFNSKADQIAEYVRGEKALLEVSGKGPRAVRVSQNLTRFATNKNARNHLVFFENGIKSRIYATAADIETAFAKLKPQGSSGVVLPFLWYAKSENPTEDTSLKGNDWVFTTTDDDAQVVRQRNDGLIEFFDGINWLPWNAPDNANRDSEAGLVSKQSDSIISISPLTVTETDTEVGDSILIIQDLPQEWPTELEGHIEQWFAAGDTIVIAPGELSQEIRTVLDLNPILLDSPLQYDHPEATTVAVIPGNMTVAEVTDTASELISRVDENGLTTLIWSSLPGYRYTLEHESNLDEWVVLQEDLDADSVAIAVNLPTEEYDPEVNYRLRKTGLTPLALEITDVTADLVVGTLTLTWTEQPSNEYLVEISDNMEKGSWVSLLPELSRSGNEVSTTLPISFFSTPQRFYRIRSGDAGNSFAEQGIVEMDYDELAGTITVTWATIPGEEYILESAACDSLGEWEAVGEVVSAAGGSAFLTIQAPADTHTRVYRVRQTE